MLDLGLESCSLSWKVQVGDPTYPSGTAVRTLLSLWGKYGVPEDVITSLLQLKFSKLFLPVTLDESCTPEALRERVRSCY